MERYIGLMSGTSADAVDAALVEIGAELSDVTLIKRISQPFEPEQRRQILDLCQPETSSVDALCRWHFRLGKIYAEAAAALLEESGVRSQDITAIGMHGQTVYHIPGEGTMQLGSAAVLANTVGIPVVHDFRSADMALGGQGAPLVPFFDQLVFGRDGRTTAVQNLGGIGNVTVVGPGTEQMPAVAFDTGPANMVMDALVERFSAGRLSYDRNGEWARQGRVHENIVKQLLEHPYFQQRPPKSTGRELFGREFVESMMQLSSLSREDWLATATAFTAASIADQYQRFILPYQARRKAPSFRSNLYPHLAPVVKVSGLLDRT